MTRGRRRGQRGRRDLDWSQLADVLEEAEVPAVRRYVDDTGYRASCACGWTSTVHDRDWRDELATEHVREHHEPTTNRRSRRAETRCDARDARQ